MGIINLLLSPGRGAHLFQVHLKGGFFVTGGIHKDDGISSPSEKLKHIAAKLKYMKLEVMQIMTLQLSG